MGDIFIRCAFNLRKCDDQEGSASNLLLAFVFVIQQNYLAYLLLFRCANFRRLDPWAVFL